MAAYRPRDDAAAQSRRYGDPRASTGAVFSSSFDTRYAPHPRSSIDTVAPSRGDGRAYEAQPIKRRTYVDSGYAGGTTSRTEYAVRPRQNSVLGEENRRPLSVLVPPMSPVRTRPIITAIPDIRERPSSPVQRIHRARDDSERYLQPAASGSRQSHHRQYSGNTVDVDRLSVENRERRERGLYNRAGGTSGPTTYPATRPPIRYSEDDGYSYTTAREGFDNLYPSRVSQRQDSQVRRDRPTSVYEISELDQSYLGKRSKAPPPVVVRQLDRVDNPEPDRLPIRSGHESDTDRRAELPTRRHSTRAPIVHQSRDEGYASQKDDYDDRRRAKHVRDKAADEDRRGDDRDNDRPRHHEGRRLPRSRDSSPERSSMGKGVAAAALGGLAAGGAVGALGKSRDKDEDSDQEVRRERRRRKHRERDPVEDVDVGAGTGHDSKPRGDRFGDKHDPRRLPRDQYDALKDEEESGSAEDQRRSRRSHRRRKHDKDKPRNGAESDSASDRADPYSSREASRENPVAVDPLRSVVRDRDLDVDGTERRRGDRLAKSGTEEISTDLGPRTVSPGEDEDERPRRVLLVEPPKERNEENKPRGILKPARQVPFPEDPNPTREGVAPLKEAGKAGIPPGARWTKISRVLVNPEALEKLHERFEEREDYVIVLRVVTKEEIGKFAEKTREIREARELEWQAELERKKKDKARGRPDPPSDADEDDDYRQRLSIEPPPATPSSHARVRSQQAADSSTRSMPGTTGTADVPTPNGAAMGQTNQIPGAYDGDVPETYSTNV